VTSSWKQAPQPLSKHEKRTAGSTWETWRAAAADGVRCVRVRWEIQFFLTFETALFFSVYPVYLCYRKIAGETTRKISCCIWWLTLIINSSVIHLYFSVFCTVSVDILLYSPSYFVTPKRRFMQTVVMMYCGFQNNILFYYNSFKHLIGNIFLVVITLFLNAKIACNP